MSDQRAGDSAADDGDVAFFVVIKFWKCRELVPLKQPIWATRAQIHGAKTRPRRPWHIEVESYTFSRRSRIAHIPGGRRSGSIWAHSITRSESFSLTIGLSSRGEGKRRSLTMSRSFFIDGEISGHFLAGQGPIERCAV